MDPNVVGAAALAVLAFGGVIGYMIGKGRIKIDFKKKLEVLRGMVDEDVEQAKGFIQSLLD